jgi:hypothetical protein
VRVPTSIPQTKHRIQLTGEIGDPVTSDDILTIGTA